MDKNKICEAMYALPNGVVVKHRKSQLLAIALLVAGVALIVINSVYGASLTNDMRSSAVLTGALLVIAGLIVSAVRMFGSRGIPFHKEKNCPLIFEELYFDRGNRADVMRSIEEGAVDQLLSLTRAKVPALTVEMYHTPDNSFAAIQAYEYADLEYHPLSELRIVDKV